MDTNRPVTANRKLQNELIFRDANERIKRAENAMELEIPEAPFICECWQQDCRQIVLLTPEEYELVRTHARRFFIAPGHASGDAEIVERSERFWVLDKS